MRGLRRGVHTGSWGGGDVNRSQSRKGNILWRLQKSGEIDSLMRRARQTYVFQSPDPGNGLACLALHSPSRPCGSTFLGLSLSLPVVMLWSGLAGLLQGCQSPGMGPSLLPNCC